MDTIIVSPLVKIVGEKLGSALLNEFGLLWSVKRDLEALENTISTIKDVLDDAEQCCLKKKQVYNWLRELKEVVYDAEDLLDEINLVADKQKEKSYGQKSRGKFIFHVNMFKPLKLGHKIKSINKRLDTIAAKKEKFHLQSTTVGPREEIYIKNRETLSKIEKESIFGRESERDKIVHQLIQVDGNEDVSIISIVGLGGVGKTSLAQLVYNNEDDLKEYFDHKIWVYVSQDYNLGRIVRVMIESMSQSKCELENLDTLAEKLTNQLKRKRFLLVLDDIWNENQEEWEKLKTILKIGAAGSKIIATTRSKRVPQIMKSSFTIELEGLSEEMSWKLFKQRTFSDSIRELDSQIIEIAKEIVKKCGGVPLALKALGSTMQFKKSVQEWLDARDSDIWKIDGGDEVIASLRLSYMNLPSRLKECFTFCSIFPKGQVIYKQEMIGQWIAHGLVAFTRSVGNIEVHKGNEYFEQLVQISFLQNVAEESNGKVTCNMHDLIHDLAQSIVAQEFQVINNTDVRTHKNAGCKYMSLTNFSGNVETSIIKKLRYLHIEGGNSSVLNMVSKARSLRSLVLEKIVFDISSVCFSKFVHLRYICIAKCEFTVIPGDIGVLWSLEALHLRECGKIMYLPESIGKLINLRTIELTLLELKQLPESIGQCQSLQNLIVQSNQINSISNSLGQLLNVQSLNFSQCHQLKRIHVNAFGQFNSINSITFSDCRELVELPISIERLISLESLNFSMCINIKSLPESIGTLCNLRIMNFSGCVDLEEIPFSIGNLVILESLNLSMCTKLKFLPESIGNLHNLRAINLQSSGIETLPASICKLDKLIMLNLYNVSLQGMPRGIGQLTSLRGLSIFREDQRSKYAHISELRHLNFLSGNLEISGLEYLNNPREATQANLKEKKNLDHLKLTWGLTSFSKDCFQYWLPVLEDLQPPSNIKTLELLGYPGAEYPSWMMLVGEMNTTTFPFLTTLTLSFIERCWTLPSLAALPHLKYLFMFLIEHLTNFCGQFPSLVELHLSEMTNLEELTSMNLITDNVYKPAFPRLSKLVISGCPKLRIQPHLPPSVMELEVKRSNKGLLAGARLHDGDPSSEVWSSPFSLRRFLIREMTSSTDCALLKQLVSLTIIKFYSCELKCLPESMRHLSSLRVLWIFYCKGLHALPEWLGELKSLKKMQIEWTPLTCLPKSMQQLTAMQDLQICGCPELKMRCERGNGKDWHLISHIPNVYIE